MLACPTIVPIILQYYPFLASISEDLMRNMWTKLHQKKFIWRFFRTGKPEENTSVAICTGSGQHVDTYVWIL